MVQRVSGSNSYFKQEGYRNFILGGVWEEFRKGILDRSKN